MKEKIFVNRGLFSYLVKSEAYIEEEGTGVRGQGSGREI